MSKCLRQPEEEEEEETSSRENSEVKARNIREKNSGEMSRVQNTAALCFFTLKRFGESDSPVEVLVCLLGRRMFVGSLWNQSHLLEYFWTFCGRPRRPLWSRSAACEQPPVWRRKDFKVLDLLPCFRSKQETWKAVTLVFGSWWFRPCFLSGKGENAEQKQLKPDKFPNHESIIRIVAATVISCLGASSDPSCPYKSVQPELKGFVTQETRIIHKRIEIVWRIKIGNVFIKRF